MDLVLSFTVQLLLINQNLACSPRAESFITHNDEKRELLVCVPGGLPVVVSPMELGRR